MQSGLYEDLTDQLYDATDKAVVRFKRPGPWRILEVENRAKSKDVVRVAKDIADLIINGEVEEEALRLQAIEAADRSYELPEESPLVQRPFKFNQEFLKGVHEAERERAIEEYRKFMLNL